MLPGGCAVMSVSTQLAAWAEDWLWSRQGCPRSVAVRVSVAGDGILLAVETGWCCRGDRAELGGGRCQAREGEWEAVGGAGGPALCHSTEASGARGRDSRRVLADPRPGYCQGDSFPTERRGPCCPRSSMPDRWPAPGQEAGLLDFTL